MNSQVFQQITQRTLTIFTRKNWRLPPPWSLVTNDTFCISLWFLKKKETLTPKKESEEFFSTLQHVAPLMGKIWLNEFLKNLNEIWKNFPFQYWKVIPGRKLNSLMKMKSVNKVFDKINKIYPCTAWGQNTCHTQHWTNILHISRTHKKLSFFIQAGGMFNICV